MIPVVRPSRSFVAIAAGLHDEVLPATNGAPQMQQPESTTTSSQPSLKPKLVRTALTTLTNLTVTLLVGQTLFVKNDRKSWILPHLVGGVAGSLAGAVVGSMIDNAQGATA